MDDKQRAAQAAELLDLLREELKEYGIQHELIAARTQERGLNGGRGYNVSKIRNMMSGRVPYQGDILTVIVTMIEEATEERENAWTADPEHLLRRVSRAKKRRSMLEANHFPLETPGA